MEEIWRTIEGAPSYQVSNMGRIKSFRVNSEGFIMKPSFDKDGYLRISLCVSDTKRIYRRVHQLVAKAFIPNPNNYKMINHLNNKRDDNRVENLEWCDNSRNQLYSYRVMGRQWNRKAHEKDFTGIKATWTNEENKEMTFDSVNACARYFKVSDSAIFNRLKGRVRNPSSSPKSPINGIYFEEITSSNDYPNDDK